jgi:hypothetical protein
VIQEAPHRAAVDVDRNAAQVVHARTASQMGRELDTTDIKGLLYRNFEHPRWDEVAERCLTCGTRRVPRTGRGQSGRGWAHRESAPHLRRNELGS